MVVWFKYGSCTVGVEDGVVRGADFAALTGLLDAASTLQSERAQLLESVEQEIEQLRSDARQQVEASLAAARKEQSRGYDDGLAEGLRDAAAEWTESALREAASTQRSLMRQTKRLSQIVALALERIVEHEDRVTLFNRALNAIAKLVRDVPMATLHVSPSELSSALSAVTAFAPCATGRLQIEVKGDSALAPGSCLFESDQGVIDAGLKTQLAAIQRAMDRAAEHLVMAEPPDSAPAGEVVGVETLSPQRTGLQQPNAENDEQDELATGPGYGEEPDAA
jgi:type III secretion protein L